MNVENINAGDYIVTRNRYERFKLLGPVSRTTKLRAYHPSEWNRAREAFSDAADVLAAGPKEAMALLHERLTSSAALKEQEQRGAYERHRARVDKLLGGSDASGEAAAHPRSSVIPREEQ